MKMRLVFGGAILISQTPQATGSPDALCPLDPAGIEEVLTTRSHCDVDGFQIYAP